MTFEEAAALMIGGTGGGVISLHDLFLQQETIVEVPLIGDYKQIFKWLPDYAGYTAIYSYSDYSNSTPEGHLFALYSIGQSKPYAVGIYKGDEYLGITLLNSCSTRCATIYSPNSDYTQTYLSRNDVLKRIYDYPTPKMEDNSYQYGYVQVPYLYCKAEIERTTYTESGVMTKSDVTETINLPGFGNFSFVSHPYADSDRIAACIDEYARLCNAKYHELKS